MEDGQDFPIIDGLSLSTSLLVYLVFLLNILWIVIWLMEFRKISNKLRQSFRVRDILYVFVLPALICAGILFSVYLVFTRRWIKNVINFQLYPRPEWLPWIKISLKWAVRVFIILLLLGVMLYVK